MSHLPVSCYLSVDVSTFLLIKIDFLLLFENSLLVCQNLLQVFFAFSFHHTLLRVIRLLENLLVCVFKILVQFQLAFAKLSYHIEVPSVLLDLLSQLSLSKFVFSVRIFQSLSALLFCLFELIDEFLHNCRWS